MPKFTYDEHEKRMRELLKPPTNSQTSNLLPKLREFTKKFKTGKQTPEIREIS